MKVTEAFKVQEQLLSSQPVCISLFANQYLLKSIRLISFIRHSTEFRTKQFHIQRASKVKYTSSCFLTLHLLCIKIINFFYVHTLFLHLLERIIQYAITFFILGILYIRDSSTVPRTIVYNNTSDNLQIFRLR